VLCLFDHRAFHASAADATRKFTARVNDHLRAKRSRRRAAGFHDRCQRDAIAIILSGIGADGTLGLRRIKEMGGFAIAQDPLEAEYDGMPRSAIDSGVADLILPAAEIPGRLRSLSEGAQRLRLPLEEPEEDQAEPLAESSLEQVRQILALVRQRTGHDFSQYKRPTLLRYLKKLENGDTLIVWKLDRLGRSLRDLITMLDSLRDRRIKFRSLTEAIDTDTPNRPRHAADDRRTGRA
jgi:hypothetical protein